MSEDHWEGVDVFQVSDSLSMIIMPFPVPRAMRCEPICEVVGEFAEHHIVVNWGGQMFMEQWPSKGWLLWTWAGSRRSVMQMLGGYLEPVDVVTRVLWLVREVLDIEEWKCIIGQRL